MPAMLKGAREWVWIVAIGGTALVAAILSPAAARPVVVALGLSAVLLAFMPGGTRLFTGSVMIGLATGIAAVNLFAIGIFQVPVSREFGWSQSEFAGVGVAWTVATVLTSGLFGRYFDRSGVRKWLVGGLVAQAMLLASLYWLQNSLVHLYVVYSLMPVLAAGTSVIAYSKLVTNWFDRSRGQALGTALAGIGVGGAVLSTVVEQTMAAYGWRHAFLALSALILLVTLPLVLLFVKEHPADAGLAVDGGRQGADVGMKAIPPQTGGDGAATRAQPLFWIFMLTVFIMAMANGGIMMQMVPVLIGLGAERQAVTIVGFMGVALMVGRWIAGLLMDRFHAPFVAAALTILPIAGLLMLVSGANGSVLIVSGLLIGFAAGAELDVVAYICGRYFGSKGFSENYGWLYAVFSLGSSLAAVLTAASFDRFGTHGPAMVACAVGYVVAALMLVRMGLRPPPDAAHPHADVTKLHSAVSLERSRPSQFKEG